MEIKILDSWLREYLKTDADVTQLTKNLSLCGPSVEKVEKLNLNGKTDYLYTIEITTNRVDLMSVVGIAKEASVILSQLGFKTSLTKPNIDTANFKGNGPAKIKFIPDFNLVYRMMGVVMQVDKITNSPKIIQDRLIQSGIRPLNNIVDITNYVMTEIGHPTHVFDYDLVKPSLKVRPSKKGELVESFDGIKYTLPGNDIVFESDKGKIIDLPGIIGTKNSVVNANTKNILFFIDTNNPVNIRKTSMTLGIRTVAATLNEKGVDPQLAQTALKRGIYMYKKYAKAKQISPIYDVYQKPPDPKPITLKHDFLEKTLGITIESDRVVSILNKLDINTTYNPKNNSYQSTPPSSRAKDIQIPVDLVEEIARIYGYHNFPSKLMKGEIPTTHKSIRFEFESKIKSTLKELKANEIYTYSLVENGPLKIKNPLGKEYSSLRDSLYPSLISALDENKREKKPFHLFEMANVYIPQKENLPKETLMLCGVFSNYSFRKAKGVLERLLESLGINYEFGSSQKPKKTNIEISIQPINAKMVIVSDKSFYYEFEVESLLKYSNPTKKFTPIPKYPPQIQDITIKIPHSKKVGDVINKIKKIDKLVTKVELIDIFENSYTFRIYFQDPFKNLKNKDILPISKKIESI